MAEQCPYGYADPHAWCAWRNSDAQNQKDGHLWVVGNDGRPFITDDEAVTAERHRRDKAAKEAEAQRHNHRIMHPIDEMREAAE